jgi:hypothetical protein
LTDDTNTTAAKVRAVLAATQNTKTPAATPAIPSIPAPGFRFTTGDKVIDLVTGARGTVAAWYQSATNKGPVYEVRIVGGPVLVRFENQLERDGPQNVPASLPRI